MLLLSGVALTALLASLSSPCSALSADTTDVEFKGISNYSFPTNFMFGVASAAYQIEGAWNEGGKGLSNWDVFVHQNPDYTPDRSTGDVAADSYHLYLEDVRIIKELGVKYYRLSLSWTRILPKGTDNYINQEGVKYYKKLFKALIKNGIQPVVTLFHWDLPQMFMELGGFTNPYMVDYFEDYARVAFKLFGDVVKIWTTMNEPHMHCSAGYGGDYFAPALNLHGTGEYLCTHYMLLAHARAYHLYDKLFRPSQQGRIGITLDAFWAEPKNVTDREDRIAAERYMQMHMGMYAHPIYSDIGDYPPMVQERIGNISKHQGLLKSRLPTFTAEEVDALRGSSDFFGLNHYTTYLMSPSSHEPDWHVPSLEADTGVKLEQHPHWPKPGSDWFSVYPPGFRKLLNWISNQYGRKHSIIITENGLCDLGGIKDIARVNYYNKYLYQLLLAMHVDKCNVEGYFAWTLMDDFEWKDGYTAKFGLYYVDFDSPKKTRKPKLSAYNYREIVKTRRINFQDFEQNKYTKINSLNNIH